MTNTLVTGLELSCDMELNSIVLKHVNIVGHKAKIITIRSEVVLMIRLFGSLLEILGTVGRSTVSANHSLTTMITYRLCSERRISA